MASFRLPSGGTRRGFFVLSLVLSLGGAAVPAGVRAQQGEGRWQAHTSMREVVDLSASPSDLWAASSGGVFRYGLADGALQAFTAGEGLHSVQTQAVAFDARRNAVWIGYQDGVLDRLDVATGTLRSFRDIARAERFSARAINRLVLRGDTLYVATSFGVVVFDPVRGEVRDTYSQLGPLAPATPVHDVLAAPTPTGAPGLWLATRDGVAYAPLGTANLQDPRAWAVESAGLPSAVVWALASFEGRLYAGTDKGLAVRGEDGRYADTGVSVQPVGDLQATPQRLLAVERFTLLAVEPGGSARRLTLPGYQDPTAVVVDAQGAVWVGDRQGGLLGVAIPPPPQATVDVPQHDLYPSGPYHNLFTDLVVDPAGNVWASGALATGELPGTGFYRLSPEGTWADYVQARVPALAGRTSFERIHADAQGNVWAGSAGNALVQVAPGGEVTVYDDRNSSLQTNKGGTNPAFILVGGIASDRDGALWVTNRAAAAPLHVRTADGAWKALSGFSCGGFSTAAATFDRIVVDSFGQKWIIVLDEANLRRVLGLLVLDTRNTPTNADDDACRFFGTRGSGGQQLPSTTVTSVVEDRDGIIWIGTDEGLAFLINSGVVASDPSATPVWPQYADREQGTFLFFGVTVNDLAVDPANRLWVATDQGAYLVQQAGGGYEIVQTFVTENSPLFSNNITAVTVHPTTGRVYFATDTGLISYLGDAVAPVEQVQDLLVYPNPVQISGDTEPSVYIEGLVEATELRILAPHGGVIARLSTRGGRTRWDGRDGNGRLVPSGVYLVVAVGQNGEGAAYGKVAVIR